MSSSSLEVSPPLQRLRMAASTLSPASWLEPRLCLPLCSVLVVSTTSTVYSAIHPCPGFPAQHSWGSAHPSGSSRLARATPFPARPSPPALDDSLCLNSHFRFHSSSALQGFAHRGDRRRSHSVSLLQGLVSLWASPCGTSLRPPASLPEGGSVCDRSVGPVTYSKL